MHSRDTWHNQKLLKILVTSNLKHMHEALDIDENKN